MKHTTYCLCLVLAVLWLVIPMSSHAVNIFSIQGVVKGTDGVPIDALLITVTNETKNLPPQTGLTGDSGPGAYAVVLINFTVSIADLNDEIKVTVEQEGTIVAERVHTITQENLDNLRVVIDVQLEEKKSAPNLIGITPDTGALTGGETVQLIGENFQDGATVTIGGNQATEVVFVSSTQLTAETPQGEAGVADVTVTNPDEQSETLSGGFTYIQSAPVITQIDPIRGPVIGGTVITITGENFQDGATVRIGESDASAVTVDDATQITATTPAGDVGPFSVVVINPDDQESNTSIQFTYTQLAPIITSITPDNDTTAGGATATLIGENFQSGATVTFGDRDAIDVVVTSTTEISIKVPESGAGIVQVTVTNPDDQSATIAFTFIEPPQFPAWDVNEDGVINIFDLVLVGNQFGQSGDGLTGDVTDDGTVNIFDLVLVASHFGESSIGAAPPRVAIAHNHRPSPEVDTGIRLRTALTELERLDEARPEIRFIANLLRQWLINTGDIPTKTKLLPNYPNPFNPETWIPYQLAQSGEVQISIYNIMGSLVRRLEIGHRHAGNYMGRSEAAYWDGRNDNGEVVTSGVYFYTLQAGKRFTQTRKMIILK